MGTHNSNTNEWGAGKGTGGLPTGTDTDVVFGRRYRRQQAGRGGTNSQPDYTQIATSSQETHTYIRVDFCGATFPHPLFLSPLPHTCWHS